MVFSIIIIVLILWEPQFLFNGVLLEKSGQHSSNTMFTKENVELSFELVYMNLWLKYRHKNDVLSQRK